MANPAHRLGDLNDAGAAITSVVQSTVFCNGRLLSVDGSPVQPHGIDRHASPRTANGSGTVSAGGIPVNREGDSDTCGHGRISGSPNVLVG